LSFLSHLQCSSCKKKWEADRLTNLCPECSKPLLARYDLKEARAKLDRDETATRESSMWRYREMLPVREASRVLTMGEGWTPLRRARRLESLLGHEPIYVKDESLNPTGSFKARGMSAAVSRALELGAREFSVPSAGNAAGALSAYAALAGARAYVFMPADAPGTFAAECNLFGAELKQVEGLITDCARVAARDMKGSRRFDISTLKEPYRIEGKKTMGYEIAEQMGWELPDAIIYPTGGGTGLIGMWKAFEEMETLGWISGGRPRMVAVQSEGCAPIVRAHAEGKQRCEPWQSARTVADGIRVPAAIGDFLILQILRESEGTALSVSDDQLLAGAQKLARAEGISACPEGGAALAALEKLKADGWLQNGERVVLFNTGSGLKYFHLWK